MRLPSILLSFIAILTSAEAAGVAPDFSKDIQPVLETNCIKCHGTEKQKGDLQLHTRAAMLAGGDSGPSIDIGKPHESLLLQRSLLPADHDDVMPPKGELLTVKQTDLIRSWIAAGAQWPENLELEAREPVKALVPTSAEDAEGLASVAVYPPAVELSTAKDYQALIAIATYADGTTRDITSKVAFVAKDPGLVGVAANRLTPKSDGDSTISVGFHGKSAEVPLSVKNASAARPISFNLDVMPVFLRTGCNTGSCHGAARGQDGFSLSLFGFDPVGDHHRLTREMGSRRVNLALPAESLMMEKALEKVPHAGGKRFESGSEYDKTLMEWLNAGAPADPKEIAKAVSLEIYPKNAVLEGAGRTLQITALAKYSDGTDRDVTSLAVFGSNNSPTASVTADGLVTAAARGEAFVTARFDTFTVGSQIIVIP
ncbi:MAG: c-type cytochrome domain-containing protein, partial [Verrucomicrobiales bacterium]